MEGLVLTASVENKFMDGLDLTSMVVVHLLQRWSLCIAARARLSSGDHSPVHELVS